MKIILSPYLESLIERNVASGRFDSPSEVVREGLRLLDDQERSRNASRDELKNDLQKGIEDLRKGRFLEFNSEDELREYGRTVIERGQAKLDVERSAR